MTTSKISSRALTPFSVLTKTSFIQKEILAFLEELKSYGITFYELSASYPKNKEHRRLIIDFALAIAKDEKIKDNLIVNKRLNYKAFTKDYGYGRVFLHKRRKFLLSLLIILLDDRFIHLRNYILFTEGASNNDT